MKKFPLLCILSFVFCIGITFGYSSEDTSHANYLADQGIITKQTMASKYRLDDKILRQEVIGMALKVKGTTLPENYTCKKYFADATKNDWICRAAELAADNGIISKRNKYANPGKYVTRAEALAMMMKAGGIIVEKNITGEFYGVVYIDENNKSPLGWQADVMETARKYDIISPNSTSYYSSVGSVTEYFWDFNSTATRAEVFAFAKNIINNSSTQSYEGFTADFGGDVDISEGWYGFGDLVDLENTPVRDFYITVQSRKSASIYDPGSTPLMEKYWNHNMYYTTMIEGMCFTGKLIFLTDEYVITASGSCNQTIMEVENALKSISFRPNNTGVLLGKDVLRQYYRLIKTDIGSAYNMRSPAGASLEAFTSWYKNTESVTFREDTLEDLDPPEYQGNHVYGFLVDMVESGKKSTYKVTSKVNLEKFTIDNISSVKQ